MMHALALSTAATGYTLQPIAPTMMVPPATRIGAPLMMSSDDGILTPETSRRAVLAGLLGLGIGSGANPAMAGYVTNLGIETTSPKDAEIDDDLLKSSAVQKGIENLKTYKSAAGSLKGAFLKDNNMPLIPSIRKEFDFSKLRDDLNVATTVFDDQTQLTIDRLSRAILYDLTELENASRFKKGEEQTRTAKKVANVEKWFTKLDNDFGEFLKYFG